MKIREVFLAFSVVTLFDFCLPVPLKRDVNLNSGYESCPSGKADKLNVHLICHTHDDVGWLKTVDQYFYGAKTKIQNAGVQYIIDSVIESLKKDPTRRFIYVETAFFWRWWGEQNEKIKDDVRKLVCSGQLQFAGGGWSMNDEAVTHYNSIIDQMTWGLRFLNDTFGSCGLPKVAWQIDPFGHSREQASLFAQMYFDGLFFGRLDYVDKSTRQMTKTMEMLWKGSANIGPLGDLFTGALPNQYSPPPGFCFDIGCADPPIMDDKRLKDYNVEERVTKFISLAKAQSDSYATDHIAMTMGEDFNYQNAEIWFKNLDKLIKYVNEQQSNGSNVNVFYSTPACYLYALNKKNTTWTTKNDDFLPYASNTHAYWTGFYTSRPSIKRFERMGNNYLQICKQLAAMTNLNDSDVTVMRRAMGVMQHHDAVTGTEKQEVTYDYAQTLSTAIAKCENVINSAYRHISTESEHDQIFCNFLNISECRITESGSPVAITVYNPLGWNITTYVRLPVTGQAYKIYGPDGSAVAAQIVDIPPSVKGIAGRTSNATHEVIFKVELPPLGYSTYLLRNSSNKGLAAAQKSNIMEKVKDDWSIGNEFFKLLVDGKTGLLKQIQLSDGTNLTLNQSFYWYRGMAKNIHDDHPQASGAYIFRPNGTSPIPLSGNVTVSAVNGSIVQEIRQVFCPWISQIIRVYKGVDNIEFNWIIGPIPVGDGYGKEIITRFDTDMMSEEKFFTDSNGREILQRQLNYRPTWHYNGTEPVSGNYYPVYSRIYIRDKARKLQMTVLSDRTQGGSSLRNGSIEIMIHRRLLYDDGYGVGEPLNETGISGKGLVIRGSHYLIPSTISSAAPKHRLLAQQLFMAPQLSFVTYNSSEADFLKAIVPKFSGLNSNLPPNVHLLTLEPWKDGTVLIRLEHFYEFDDDPSKLSKPINVSLKGRFKTFEIVSLKETTLSANQFTTEAVRLYWNTTSSNQSNFLFRAPGYQSRSVTEDLVINLTPMRIRTFIAEVKRP